jgi:hypothetical protein
MDIEGVDFTPNGIFAIKFFNHSATLPTNSKAINFDSMVDLAIIVYLADFQ